MTTSTSDVTAAPPPPLRRDRAVQVWVLAAGVSALGDTIWLIGLAWSAVHLVGTTAAGVLVALGSVPRAVVVVGGGVLADRVDPRRVVVAAHAVRAALLVVAAFALGRVGSDAVVLGVVALVFGVAEGVHDPAAATLPRTMVRTEDLGAVAGLFQTAMRLARLVGAPLGGLLLATSGVRATMLADAGTFLVIAVAVAAVVHPRCPRPAASGASWRADLASGLSYVRRDTRVRMLVLALSGLNLFVTPALALGLTLRVAQESWGGAPTLGLLEATVGLGAVGGALAATRWRSRRPEVAGLLVLVVQGLGIAGLGLGPLGGAAGGVLVVGVTAGLASALLSGAFQALVAPAYLGRTSALTSMADDLLMPAAMAGFGAAAGVLSAQAACVLAGAGMVALCLGFAARLRAAG